MEPWILGLVALIVVGVAVILFGALRDRQLNRRRAAEVLAPPPRVIPRLDPQADPPRYLSELQARRPPAGVTVERLSREQRTTIETEMAHVDTLTLRNGYADRGFVTDAESGWAVLDHPAVVVCADAVTSVRELLPTIEPLNLDRRAFVLLAPELSKEVRSTLAVNVIQGKLRAIVIVAPVAELQAVADLVGALPLDRGDRQSGYVEPEALGRATRWVSTRSASYVVPDPAV